MHRVTATFPGLCDSSMICSTRISGRLASHNMSQSRRLGRLQHSQNSESRANNMSANPSSPVLSGFDVKLGVLMLPANCVAGGGGGGGGSTTPGVLMFPANAGMLSTTPRIVVAKSDFRVLIWGLLKLEVRWSLNAQLDTKIGSQLKDLYWGVSYPPPRVSCKLSC